MSAAACPRCHRPIPDDAPQGVCPPCAFGDALDGPDLAGALDTEAEQVSPSSAPPSVGRSFGKYENLELIARGGMGAVYRAWDTVVKRHVALKMILRGEWATEDQLRRFREEAEAIARLDHPNIVPLLGTGEEDGRAYFTMKLMGGGCLADHLDRYRGDPRAAAELVETIARAVQHAHERGILHRDLKPANILLDDDGQPYVADFGVAKHVHKTVPTSVRTLDGTMMGCAPYMAPEQAEGRVRAVTTATDVYGLGAILYELCTGRPPFEGETEAQILDKVRNEPPAPPRSLEPSIDRDLEVICLKCLEKSPKHRYGSAEALAIDLRRYLRGEPIDRISRAERALRFCLRHPLWAGLMMAAALFLVIATSSAIAVVSAEEANKQAQIRNENRSRADRVAGTVLAHLRDLGDAVSEAAADPAIARALEAGDDAALQAACASVYRLNERRDGQSPVHMWYVFDARGISRARFPEPVQEILGKDYSFRDYFRGAMKLAERGLRTGYVSRAFQSENDGRFIFGVSTPIYGTHGQPVGILMAGVPAAASLGSRILDDGRSIGVLVAPRGRERASAKPASTHLILIHEALAYGDAIPIENPLIQRIDDASIRDGSRYDRPLHLPRLDRMESSDAYEDPAAQHNPTFAGRWLAAFAPVGNTGFVVVFQTRAEEALGSEKKLVLRLAKWAGLAATPGALLIVFAALYERRRAARRARRAG
jgi:serine/threonine-protein kinase